MSSRILRNMEAVFINANSKCVTWSVHDEKEWMSFLWKKFSLLAANRLYSRQELRMLVYLRKDTMHSFSLVKAYELQMTMALSYFQVTEKLSVPSFFGVKTVRDTQSIRLVLWHSSRIWCRFPTFIDQELFVGRGMGKMYRVYNCLLNEAASFHYWHRSELYVTYSCKWFKHAQNLVWIIRVLVWYGYTVPPILGLLVISYSSWRLFSVITIFMTLRDDDLFSDTGKCEVIIL